MATQYIKYVKIFFSNYREGGGGHGPFWPGGGNSHASSLKLFRIIKKTTLKIFTLTHKAKNMPIFLGAHIPEYEIGAHCVPIPTFYRNY